MEYFIKLWILCRWWGWHKERFCILLYGGKEESASLYASAVLVYADKDLAAAATAKSHQSCPTLCNPIDGSPLGSSVPGILQARILE